MSVSKRFPVVEFGNPTSKDVVVLLAGFPDDAISGWLPLIDRMKASTEGKDRRYICLCLPGYENDAPPLPRWGYTFPELMTHLHATLETLVPGDNKYSLIIHDWGCYVGYVIKASFHLTLFHVLFNLSSLLPFFSCCCNALDSCTVHCIQPRSNELSLLMWASLTRKNNPCITPS